MAEGKVRKTPTGYGVIKVAARKQIVLPSVDAPSVVQSTRTGAKAIRPSGQIASAR